MLLTWLHICFSIFILNDNLQTLRKHCMHISAVTGAGNTPLYGDMIFSKICFVVTFALSVFLGIHKSSCKAPRWSCSRSQVLLCRITTKVNKKRLLSHIDVGFVIGPPLLTPTTTTRSPMAINLMLLLYLTSACPLQRKHWHYVIATWNTYCTQYLETTIAGLYS